MEMKLTILFCEPSSKLSKVVSFFSGRFSHTAIMWRGIIYSARPFKGVIQESIIKYLYSYEVIKVKEIEITGADIRFVDGYIYGSLGKKYSIFQFLRIFLKRCFNFSLPIKKRVEFAGVDCSEWVYYLLLALNKVPPQSQPFNVLPDDLYNLL